LISVSFIGSAALTSLLTLDVEGPGTDLPDFLASFAAMSYKLDFERDQREDEKRVERERNNLK
jgi:hypothetical protein